MSKSRRLVQLLWGCMDAFYICFVVFASLRRGAIPFLTDFNTALTNVRNWGEGLEALIWIGAVAQISVLASCVLFYMGRTAGIYLAVAQIPLRVLFVIPSVSVVLLFSEVSTWFWMSLVLASEGVKIWSLWWLWNGRKPGQLKFGL